MSEPTKEQIDEMIRGCFEMFDQDRSGAISVEELKQTLKKQFGGMEFSDAECQSVINELDRDGSGQVDFEEFKAGILSVLGEKKLEQRCAGLLEAFRLYDKDGSGYITKEEIKEAAQESGNPLTDEQIQEVIDSIGDTDKDGRINFKEFSQRYVMFL